MTASAAPDLYLARDLHAPTVVAVDGADSRNPEGTAAVVICRTCSDWDGSPEPLRAEPWPCATAKALGVRG